MRRDPSTRSGYDPSIADSVLDALPLGSRQPFFAGLSGLQGSGKSTFARQLVAAARTRDIAAIALSLDDFYLSRRARRELAQRVHPLFATRGVPGTHDVPMILDTLSALAHANPATPARLPRFDKGRDTRLSPSRWRKVRQVPRLVLFEGWCVGVPAQGVSALAGPINALERDEDPDARWRGFVDAQLLAEYAPLWKHLDALILLEAPAFDVVARWRDEQEQALRDRGAPHAMDANALTRFLMHYERLSRHALAELPALADVRVILDAERGVRGVARRERRGR